MRLKTLTEFYQSYADWLDRGAPEDEPYKRGHSLCFCLDIFVHPNIGLNRQLDLEMMHQFRNAGLNPVHPFGDEYAGYMGTFFVERANGTAYLNEKRIQWVRSHLS